MYTCWCQGIRIHCIGSVLNLFHIFKLFAHIKVIHIINYIDGSNIGILYKASRIRQFTQTFSRATNRNSRVTFQKFLSRFFCIFAILLHVSTEYFLFHYFFLFINLFKPYSSEGEGGTIHSRRTWLEPDGNFRIKRLAPARGVMSRLPPELKISA